MDPYPLPGNDQIWVSTTPESLPNPVIVKAQRARVTLRISDSHTQEIDALLSSSGRSFEISTLLKTAIYGEVVRGMLIEKTSIDPLEFRRTGTPCAIKIYLRKRLRELQGRTYENPLAEIPAMQYIGNNHPNLMGQIETCTDDERLYVVMKYCAGGELFDYIDEHGPLDNPTAKRMFRQLLSAVSYLQKLGLAHRDMSLENVLYDGEHTYVIIDFGMVVRLKQHRQNCVLHGITYNEGNIPDINSTRSFFQYYCWLRQHARCGKRNYIAPEVHADQRPAHPMLADMWGLGVMLFIALTGVPPVDSATMADERFSIVAEGRLGDLLQFWNYHLDPHVVDLMTRMLNPDPLARPTIEQILAHPWMTTP